MNQPPLLSPEEQQLWEAICRFDLDQYGVDFSFSKRLQRENGWSAGFAERAIGEYKKFMFLICVSGEALTPSDEVDQVWHLHLLYTRSYWEDFCGKVLGRTIHHGPTKGGVAEADKFEDWYARTKQWYRKKFEQEPPTNLWPPAERRFGELRFQRVNLHRYWVFRRWW